MMDKKTTTNDKLVTIKVDERDAFAVSLLRAGAEYLGYVNEIHDKDGAVLKFSLKGYSFVVESQRHDGYFPVVCDDHEMIYAKFGYDVLSYIDKRLKVEVAKLDNQINDLSAQKSRLQARL